MTGAKPWLEADWPTPPGVRAFTTLRHGAGVSEPPFDSFNLGPRCGDVPERALANRAALVELAGLPSEPRWLRQVHGVEVVRFEAGPHPNPSPVNGRGAQEPDAKLLLPLPLAGEGWGEGAPEPEADASVTSTPGTVLAIQTADCLPVLFCADDGREVGGAHAGWRGLAAGVLEATVAAMRTPSERLMAWLGPAAGPTAYEIGTEVRDAFVSHDPAAAGAFVPTRDRHWHVDLYALARMRLQAAGLSSAKIHGGGLCTISDADRFFSHRRDARTGRMGSLIWITPG
ncbi:peptidoglycan editing factor PgeF [Marilutibacter alkalisoli]|uniref:Purine nucleoside phosphorylase n=1 Tax=Marilutibacter alkalisoli TaxID=2591633 RepID=A0A514BU81_9GAMM|nr:peptidoglycan editing factor PgeF [Lysobacter alkalisoli]QDH70926.1 peptidoglycan editing factor PgeF [Lysobacter alkalisoli]